MVLPVWSKIRAWLFRVVGLVLLGAAFYGGQVFERQTWQARENRQLKAANDLEAQKDTRAHELGARVSKAQSAEVAASDRVIREIISARIDEDCRALPPDLVRLYNTAARGSELDPVPGSPDAAGSDATAVGQPRSP